MFDIEPIVRRYVNLNMRPTSNGWFSVLCQVCNDHGKKGPRGGFRFEDGGMGYHCFNCNHKAAFSLKQTEPLSNDVIKVFNSYHIPESEWAPLHLIILENNSKKGQNAKPITPFQKPINNIDPEVIKLPPHFRPITDFAVDNDWRFIAEDHLKTKRGMRVDEYPFFLSDDKSWQGRLIIPIYNRRNELIFYQGRTLIDHPEKYKNPVMVRSKVMYGFDQIYTSVDLPLYITEGFFDAYVIKGCCGFGNELSKDQIEHLNRSPRKKVLVPDQFGNGLTLAMQAIDQGWSVSTPKFGDCKDVSEACLKYGKMYTFKTLAEHTNDGFTAEINAKLYCKK